METLESSDLTHLDYWALRELGLFLLRIMERVRIEGDELRDTCSEQPRHEVGKMRTHETRRVDADGPAIQVGRRSIGVLAPELRFVHRAGRDAVSIGQFLRLESILR